MSQECKICLPPYKLFYSLCYVIILSFIRGISQVEEIGVALDPNIGLLALVFCAETYQMEYRGKRWEVFTLFPLKNRIRVIYRRLFLQMVYLYLLAFIGYGCFYWQRPHKEENISSLFLLISYGVAVAATILLWGTLSMTIANLFRNQWCGIGICLVLWLFIYSKAGEKLMGSFNFFSYCFRDLWNQGDLSWLWGKGFAVVLTVGMLSAVGVILKKRG